MRFVLLFSCALALAAQAPPQTAGPWTVDTAVLPSGGGAPSESGITLKSGMAWRPTLVLRDGTIDLQLPAPTGAFAGLAFRMASTADYEIIYFNATPDRQRWATVQYQPVFQGETTWQLYYRDGYRAELPETASATPHIRLVVAGRRADVFIDQAREPLLRIRELKRDPIAGGIGVWTAGPLESAPLVFSGVSVNATPPADLAPLAPVPVAPGQIMRWHVSQRYPSPGEIAPPVELPPDLRLATRPLITAEESGIVNLTKILGNSGGPQRQNVFGGVAWGVAYAGVTLTSDAARRVGLAIAYSDGAGVYLNGARLYSGNNASNSRYDGYTGFVDREFETIDLPLKSGANALVLAVTDKAFGWGFKARLVGPRDGVRVE